MADFGTSQLNKLTIDGDIVDVKGLSNGLCLLESFTNEEIQDFMRERFSNGASQGNASSGSDFLLCVHMRWRKAMKHT
ncbi:hypothetical protein P8452_41633 [Trifolium repens]|nr:hypothetical protein P8452_41633 [Trifolium repens]